MLPCSSAAHDNIQSFLLACSFLMNSHKILLSSSSSCPQLIYYLPDSDFVTASQWVVLFLIRYLALILNIHSNKENSLPWHRPPLSSNRAISNWPPHPQRSNNTLLKNLVHKISSTAQAPRRKKFGFVCFFLLHDLPLFLGGLDLVQILFRAERWMKWR